jgi:DNA-binding GntR family transcriptional regulator
VINKSTYKDYVVAHVYERLQKGELNPGDQVLESHLATELGLSRAPIREALQQLVGDGLLTYKPQIGNFVAALSPKEIIDAYVTRGLLEGFAVAEALETFTGEDLEDLEELCLQMEKHARRGKQKDLIESGTEFHQLLFNKSDNIQLIEYTQRLSQKLHLLFYKHWASLYTPEEIRDRHQGLVHLLREKNRALVEQALRQHYSETGQKVARFYEESGEGE